MVKKFVVRSLPIQCKIRGCKFRGGDFIFPIVALIGAGTLVAGCGSATNTRAGAISVTDPSGTISGQLTSVAVNRSARLSMTPQNDAQGAGVDWSVTCGGSPLTGSITGGACGTLSPAHTPDGSATLYTAPSQVPIGTTVTIDAAVTSDPSAASSVALTITSPSIAIAFSPATPASLTVSATVAIAAVLVNDVTGAGVKWTASCGSGSASGSGSGVCGSFSLSNTIGAQQTTYTAPSAVPDGGSVTITATSVADSTRSLSATVNILPAAPPVAVTISPPTLTVGENSTADLVATVANDPSNGAVAWTVTCVAPGSCGSITPSTPSGGVAVYTAPAMATGVNPVQIVATAAATSSTATPVASTATATVTAASTISVSVTATPSSVLPLGSAVLTATVQNDATNAGVTWGVTCSSKTAGACGTISNQSGSNGSYAATYTAPAAVPAGGSVTVSASSTAALNAATNAPGTAPVADNPGLATIAIATGPPSIAFLRTPPAVLVANGEARVSAVVTNDLPPGGVTWTVQCGSADAGACGYVQPYRTANAANATYVAPPVPPSRTTSGLAAGQVAIVATSTSSAGTSVVSAPVTITASTALSVRFVPFAPTQMQAGATVNLQAAVGNDASSAGVDWQVCASECGYFTTVPAISAIAATPTTPFVPAIPAVTKTTVSGWPNNLPIPYTAPTAAGTTTITALAHANTAISTVASVAITTQATGPALNGHVMAGAQPVAGASVSLYVAGTGGYGSAATLLYSPVASPAATTSKDGSFTLSGGYTCPAATSQAYLVAAGGQVGTFVNNSNLKLMTALGPCGSLGSTPVVLNEVTTVASAWPLARFAANDALTGKSSYLYLGSDTVNATGLANAFASVNNLVDVTTGQALFSVPSGNANVPYAEIDTLADILNTCTDSAGGVEGDGSPCGFLFTATDPLGYNAQFSSTPPADTVQAAFNIAQHPAPGGFGGYDFPGPPLAVGDLAALATPASPFQPVLNATPNDFSISLNYTGGGGLSASSSASYFALDGSGNLWITDTAGNSAIEWNNAGTPLAPAGFTVASLVGPGPVAIDASGNAWICDGNGLTELNGLGTEQQGSPFIGGGVSGTCQGLAFDGLGNLWVSNSNSASKLNGLGVPLSPSTGYTIATSPTDATIVPLLTPIAIDDANNVWVGVNGPGGLLYLAELNDASGLPSYLNGPPTGTAPLSNYITVNSDVAQKQIAIDAAGDVWVPSVNSGQPLTKVSPYAGPGTTDQTSAGFAGSGEGTDPFTDARGVAIDGAGLVWVASTGATGPVPQPAGLVEVSESNSSNYAYYVSASLASRALSLAVDSSGNIWALLDNNTITEYVGLATPAVTPLAAAVKNRKLGEDP